MVMSFSRYPSSSFKHDRIHKNFSSGPNCRRGSLLRTGQLSLACSDADAANLVVYLLGPKSSNGSENHVLSFLLFWLFDRLRHLSPYFVIE